MKVTLRFPYASPHGACAAGQALDLPDDVASDLIGRKLAAPAQKLAAALQPTNGAAEVPPASAAPGVADPRLSVPVADLLDDPDLAERLARHGLVTAGDLQRADRPTGFPKKAWAEAQEQLAAYLEAAQ